jgi:hypothetical protein
MDSMFGEFDPSTEISECHQWFINEGKLIPGNYTLINEIASPMTGEIIALKGTRVKVEDFAESHDTLFGLKIYKVLHSQTNQEIFITNQDIQR